MMQPAASSSPKTRTTLVDITKCIGCRACQVACKQWNDKDGEQTELEAGLGFQKPAVLGAKTLPLISFHEIPGEKEPRGLHPVNTLWRRPHSLHPALRSTGSLPAVPPAFPPHRPAHKPRRFGGLCGHLRPQLLRWAFGSSGLLFSNS